MSGILAVLHLDGAPVDRGLLREITMELAARGPDAQDCWASGPVGFGHTLLRTTWESAGEVQPLTLDGRTWITADCRIDARNDLRKALEGHGSRATVSAPDAELILRAYAVWGDRCVDHLLGDFAFAIWDGARDRLFCARDHVGVKPFFYAKAGSTLVVCNDLAALRRHPSIAAEADLDEVAVADFLLFSFPLDADRTAFSVVRRLPAAHTLSVAGSADQAVQIRRYWEFPLEDELSYPRRADYVDHFLELLQVATSDRLRTHEVAVMMSGGLDSPSVAAAAKETSTRSGTPLRLSAHTVVFDRIVPDQERKYSTSVARALGIPITHYPFDDYRQIKGEPEPYWYCPEPTGPFDRSYAIAVHQGPAQAARVLLRGEGGDPLLDAGSTVETMLRTGQYGRLVSLFMWLTFARRQMPRIGLRSLTLRALGFRGAPAPAPVAFGCPDWLAPDLDRRVGLRERWQVRYASAAEPRGAQLRHPWWPFFFETVDPGAMRLPAEVRYPFFDLRLARFLTRVPAVPWAAEKSLFRIAMKDRLPQEILHRPKAPLAGHPWAVMLPDAETRWWAPLFSPARELARFVDVSKAEAALSASVRKAQAKNDHANGDDLRLAMQPLGLNLWLRQIAQV